MTQEQILSYLDSALAHARAADFEGWSKHDGLNSPLLEALSLGTPALRLCFIQGVMRFPIDLRRILRVRRTRNNKGIALFAQALLDRGRALAQDEDLDEARALLDWLLNHPAPFDTGLSWGYPYPWQNAGFFAPRNSPNRVVTAFAASALMEGYEELEEPRYLDAAGRAIAFLLDTPNRIVDTNDHLCLSYVPDVTDDCQVINVSMLVAAVAARHASLTGERTRLADARRLAAYVVDKQTGDHAWYYTNPPDRSPITHDNYHTGFILSALQDYMRYSGDHDWVDAYAKGLGFYRERLFDEDGAPRWMYDRPYPRDVHGSAQGILTFLQAAEDPAWGNPDYRETAHRVARWTCENLWIEPPGRFAWQRTPRRLKTHDLLRWCQGWMSRALAALLRSEADRARGH